MGFCTSSYFSALIYEFQAYHPAVRNFSSLLKSLGLCALSLQMLTFASAENDTPPPVTMAQIDDTIKRGVDFLVTDQNKDGSWGSATRTKHINIYAPLPGAHLAFRSGATGLALSGLIDSADTRPEAVAAIEKCAVWSAKNLPLLRRADQTTTYNIWGHAYGLRSLIRLHQREANPEKKALYKTLAQQQIDLVGRYEDINGGFGYLDVFDDFTSQRPTGITTSFSSATVLLSMYEGREKLGLTLNDKLVGTSLDSIKRQQFPDKSYAYSHNHILRPRYDINRPAGSLARSQACNAALRVYDREGITDEVIIEWADRFLAKAGYPLHENGPNLTTSTSRSPVTSITTESTISPNRFGSCLKKNKSPTPKSSLL
jgi:hypothetical protein